MIENKLFKILKESIDLYKNNYRLFILITGLATILQIIFTPLTNLISKIGKDSFIAIPLLIIIIIPFIYYKMRLDITLIKSIRGKYNNNNLDFKETYLDSSKLIGKYFKTFFLLALMIIIPIVLVSALTASVDDILSKILIIVLVGVLILYLLTNYFLAPIISVINPEIEKPIKYSKRILQGQTRDVLLIFLIIIILSTPSYFINNHLNINIHIVKNTINYCMIIINNLIIFPIIIGFIVKYYIQLIEKDLYLEN